MRLTSRQLRKLIISEARGAMRENSDAPTNPVAKPTNTGDDSPEKMVYDFCKKLYEKKFRDVVIALQDAYKVKGKQQVEREKGDEPPTTQRSPRKMETLIRSYVKMLFEVKGDEGDFRATYPTLSRFFKFYFDNEGLWGAEYDQDAKKDIGKILKESYDDVAEFIATLTKVASDISKIRLLVGGDAGEKAKKFVYDVWVPAVTAFKEGMSSGKKTGWLDDPRLKMGAGYKEDDPSRPALPVSGNKPKAGPTQPKLRGSGGPTKRSP